MPITDKIEAAKRIKALLDMAVQHAGLRMKYRITVDPAVAEDRDWERPEILVELAGSDSPLLLSHNAELLRALEYVAIEMLGLASQEHDKVTFDCQGYRAARIEELRMSARLAAEQVRKSGRPYEFSAMSSRERRIVHLALREQHDLKTESKGEGGRRFVVVYPKDYSPGAGGGGRRTRII